MKQREESHAILMKNTTTLPQLMVYGYPYVKKQPSDQDPSGLSLCWENGTSFLLAVQLPWAISAKITMVIGWNSMAIVEGGERRKDKECLKSL